MDAVTNVPQPVNEPVHDYAPGSRERDALIARLEQMAAEQVELTMSIDGEHQMGGGEPIDVVQPHNHKAQLGTLRDATADDVRRAVAAAKAAAPEWQHMSFDDRAAIFLKAADLLSGPWRITLNAATMLGQSKTCYQAEIDTPCELADFWRFNVSYARQLLEEQPISGSGVWNRLDHRPLEGFVLAITPFNFTAIAGNLSSAPALMGNTVVWKPAPTQQLAAHYTMRLLETAGLPPGVINMVTGTGQAVSEVAIPDPDLAGIHFTGSTATFGHLWDSVAGNLRSYRAYPRLVGETGGKDFVVAHPSADIDVLRTALVRGAFEYQGQKCSAASRAYVPRSLWTRVRDDLVSEVDALSMGDVTDFHNFMGAVIDDRSFAKLSAVIDRVRGEEGVEIAAGGMADDTTGYFVRPTVIVADNPEHEVFTTEYFGPILGVFVYDDADYDTLLRESAAVGPYGLTGAIIAQDRAAIVEALDVLRFAAGNFYINDKPTGAVVGQQPFGGARGSGTNDKAGSILNLQRWVSPRTIKETFVPATDYRYPFME
ncbi:MAG TPA: L-glutamate gamma-semialdehyde dehydrogenase [Propionibacteriaceae bacterium]|jgi:1-pyrroline-5-carboxylate dehydrogenase|nr:L-glutamate gamma-semialdehyde dehydrogenase [Propionibacteriaceae bacterium]